ncbi:MAG: DUF89 family protein [Euryarchaeota archaeon]|nr:DUF89 family protein [Euryarchaeota archaeon]MBV1730101.1 DUF89 family protein [Methanobacterium sp.]MBU4548358.1 DUF89 family protein [Euryarchaeota archaeon]MBU4607920.1 DUF89 family protein [Euryarchaeota archaeon]MBV1755647.1 DUF89 family protein [Methanobacterium sp.]
MKVYYECASCFLRQSREALELATDDEKLRMEITEKIIDLLASEFKKGAPSNLIGTSMHRLIKDLSGNPDPYLQEKKRGNLIAEKFQDEVAALLKQDPSLINYIKVAIAGNLLDFAAMGVNFDPSSVILEKIAEPLIIDHSSHLEEALNDADSLLYLADNVGEIVFDKMLLEKLAQYDLDITVAVKEKPIVNDATMEDALEIGLDQMVNVTTTGTDSVGIIYSQISPEFKELVDAAELIISKGMGNYEGLTEMEIGEKNVFCLLNVKCSAISQDIGVKEGSAVLLKL